MKIYEKWNTKAMSIIAFSTAMSYDWSFSYSRKDCNVEAYGDAKAMLESLNSLEYLNY